MDLLSLFQILARRWMIALPVFLLGSGVAFGVASNVEPDYEASAIVLLSGSNPTGDSRVGLNPLEDLRQLNITAQAMAIILTDATIEDDLRSRDIAADFAVSVTPNTPILTIDAQASSPPGALRSRDALVDILGQALEGQQQSVGAPANRLITPITISESSTARRIDAARNRAFFGLLALGAILAAGAAVFVDQVLPHRTRKPSIPLRRDRAPADVDPHPPSPATAGDRARRRSDRPSTRNGTDTDAVDPADTGDGPPRLDAVARIEQVIEEFEASRRGRDLVTESIDVGDTPDGTPTEPPVGSEATPPDR